jgi:hypothetical protein
MVSFIGATADPRIAAAKKRRRDFLANALKRYEVPQNPYGGSPVWGNLQRLAEGYLAGQAGKRATSLEKAQKDAQAKIMAQILQLQKPPAGSTLNIQEAEEIRGIGDDGRIIPAQVSRRPYSREMPTISAEVLETAGLSPAGWQLAAQKARTAGKTAYTAAQKEELENRLGTVTQALALDPSNTELFQKSQQLRALLEPAAFAKEAGAEQLQKAKETRAEKARIRTEDRALKRDVDAEQRALLRQLGADERAAIEWGRRHDKRRTDQTADQIAAEDRQQIRDEAKEKQRLKRDLNKEDRDWLRLIRRKELELGITLDAEARADLRTKEREYRGILRTLDTEKRALAAAIAAEERRLETTLNAEDRARIAGEVRAKFDDERAEIRAIAAAKRKRVDVYDRATNTQIRITQEEMDIDQEGAAPKYKYDKPATGRVGFVHFVPTTDFSAGGRNYSKGIEYQVTQENIRADPGLSKLIETQSNVVRPSQLEKRGWVDSDVEQPKPPSLTADEMVDRIRAGSANDLPGLWETITNSFTAFLTLSDVYPETRAAKKSLDVMRTTMRVPLVKALSEKGSVFTQQQINKILPSSGKTDAENMALIGKLIPMYETKLVEAKNTLINTKPGSRYNVIAGQTKNQIDSLLPKLRQMVTAWDNRNQGNQATPDGTIRLRSGVTVRRVSK